MSSSSIHTIRKFLLCGFLLCSISWYPEDTGSAWAAPPSAVLARKNSVLTVTVRNRVQQQLQSVSATVVDPDGLVATTCGIVITWLTETQSSFHVVTADGTEMPVIDVLGCNRKTNTAILRIPAEGLPMASPAQKKSYPQRGWLAGREYATGAHISPIQISSPKKNRPADMIPITALPKRLAGGAILNDRGDLIGLGTTLPSGASVLIPWDTLRGQRDLYKRLARKNRLLDAIAPQRQAVASEPHEVVEAQKRADAEPGNADAWMAVGRACDSAHLWERAIQAWKRAVLIAPHSADAHIGLGLSAYHAGRYRDSVAAYGTALRLQPQSVSLHIKMGASLLILGEFREAVSVLKRAAELDAKNASAHFNLGVAHYLSDDKNAAMLEYLRLVPLDPGLAKNLYDLMN